MQETMHEIKRLLKNKVVKKATLPVEEVFQDSKGCNMAAEKKSQKSIP